MRCLQREYLCKYVAGLRERCLLVVFVVEPRTRKPTFTRIDIKPDFFRRLVDGGRQKETDTRNNRARVEVC